MDTPGAQISTGRTEDEDGEYFSRVQPIQRSTTRGQTHAMAFWSLGQPPGHQRSAWLLSRPGERPRGERGLEGTHEGSLPLFLSLQGLALRWEKDAIPATREL